MLVSRRGKRFGEYVGDVVRSGDVMELDASSGLFVMGVVILHCDVLGFVLCDSTFDEKNGSLIVTGNRNGACCWG